MKKAGFFTFLFLAFQSISFAQLPNELNYYSIGIGMGNQLRRYYQHSPWCVREVIS